MRTTPLLRGTLAAFSVFIAMHMFAQLNWTQLTGMQMDVRLGAVSFAIAGKGYIGTGDVHGVARKDLWEYDPGTDSWSQKADYGGAPCTFAVGFAVGSKGYIGVGYPTTEFWEYDPGSNAWTQKANFGGGVRYAPVAFSIGSKGYLGTGSPGIGGTNDLWEYDPSTDLWTQKASIPGPVRFQAVAFSIGAKGYIGTGTDPVNYVSLKDFWEYDPVLDTWTQRSDVGPLGRNRAMGFGLGTKGYITGGQNSNANVVKDVWQYDPTLDSWTQKNDFAGAARMHASAFCIGGTAYLGMGSLYSSYFYIGVNDLWAYDPTNDLWTPRAPLGRIGRFAGFAFTLGGKAYVGAGSTGSQAQKDMWEFDPIYGGVWTQKADFPGTPRLWPSGFATATKGYVCLGLDPSFQFNNDLWEYDPSSNTWTPRNAMPAQARHGAVAFTAGNRCFVGLGAGMSGPMADLYEYDTLTDQWSARAPFPGTARTFAVGFGMNGRGYVGTGLDAVQRKTDFFEYDPVADTWAPKASYPGTARYAAAGFSIGTKGYIGTGDNGFNNQEFFEYDQGTDTWIQRLDFGVLSDRKDAMAFTIGNYGYITCGRTIGGNMPLQDIWMWNPYDCMGVIGGPTVPGSACDDLNPNTYNDVWSPNCYCYGTYCADNLLSLELQTDGNGAQTSWDIVLISTNTVQCSGGISPTYPNNTLITANCCLPDGCYELRVKDTFGDGMTIGGYRLKDQSGKRIIDNWGDGVFTTLSQIALNTGFCLDLGTDALMASSCDQMNLAPTSILVADQNPAVTAQYNITNATSGYQFQIFNPDGGYLRNIFQNMTTGAGTGAQKSRSLALNFTTNPVPALQLLNIRVRGRINNVNNPYGPVCRMKIDPVIPCSTTQLDNNPLNIGTTFSCGATGKIVAAMGYTGKIYAIPAAGATNYRFRLVSGSYTRILTVTTTYLTLGAWSTQPLLCGVHTYNVDIAISKNSGASYCPYGPVCTVGINNPGGSIPCTSPFTGGDPHAMHVNESTGELSMWPNPNRGDALYLSMTGIDTGITEVSVDVHDLFGKRVIGERVVTGGGDLNHVMELGSIAPGVYTVTVSAGNVIKTQRLVIQ